MIEFYYEYSNIIKIIYGVSAIVWIGSMVGYVFSSYPAIKQIPNEKLMIRTSLRTLKRVADLNIFASLALLLSGVLISLGDRSSETSPFFVDIIRTQALLWSLMFANTIIIYLKVFQAKKKCFASDSEGARDNVRFISNYLIILNIFLGLIALYFGMLL